MSRRSRERSREPTDGTRRTAGEGPIGTMLGMTFGPFGAAFGSVVDANRVAFTFSFGTGAMDSNAESSDDMDGAATIEIEDTGEDTGEDAGKDTGENAGKDAGEDAREEESTGTETGSDADDASA